jgi:DNA (cytosine-5)-methyltransferase 1
MWRDESQLASHRLQADDEREAVSAPTSPEIHPRALRRLPSSLFKPSLRNHFDWENSCNDDYASRPVLLDLFAGAGGAAFGYYLAGFRVVGVDIKPQPRYPFEFIQDDALGYGWTHWWHFSAIHASPPCQLFSRASKLRDAQGGTSSSVNMIPQTRMLLKAAGKPYIIENVPGSPLRGVTLCGSVFGLGVRRHRIFESNVIILGNGPCRHKEQGRPVGIYHVLNDHIPSGGTTARTLEEGQIAMGIDWTTWRELTQAIPPAYTEFIGKQLMAAIKVKLGDGR